MRTTTEIIQHIANLENEDVFGFQRRDLLRFLSFSDAKPFLNANATEDKWTTDPLTHDFVVSEIHDYMPFAWDKANNCRGLSAGRSVEHMKAWLWLLGDDLG